MLLQSNSGLVFNEPTNKVWQSPMVDLGYPNRDKVISEIYLNTVSDCTFKISVDNKVKIFRVKGKDQVVTIRPYLKGKKFSLRIETNDTNVKIEPLQLKVGLL